MDLKTQLLAAGLGLAETDFDTHQSDLYVRELPRVRKWLKDHYPHYCNVTSFVSQIDNKVWLDVPFANEDFWRHAEASVNAWAKRAAGG